MVIINISKNVELFMYVMRGQRRNERVSERESETDREIEKEREREREREREKERERDRNLRQFIITVLHYSFCINCK